MATVLIGLLFSLPGIFVVLRTIRHVSGLRDDLSQIIGPLGRTFLLATAVSATTAIIGTSLAWLVVRSDLPGRSVWRVVLALPLVLPSFVGAAAFLAALAPRGILSELFELLPIDGPSTFRGFVPSWFVLSVFTYPYVLLPVAARLLSLRPSLEESATLLGRSPAATFIQVTYPQIRSSILAGALLVFLYTVSDLGAVQLLGYDTLTRVIFATKLFDQGLSFASASVLIMLAVVVVGTERTIRSDVRPDEKTRAQVLHPQKLGWWKVPALAFTAAVASFGLFVPVTSLATWGIRGLLNDRVDLSLLVQPAVNTALVGIITAIAAVCIVLPVAVLTIRHQSQVASVASVAVIGGFAVPGIVIAISLAFWTLNVSIADRLYQTLPLLIIAYVIHFGSQAMGATEAAVRAVPTQLRESAKLLDASWMSRFRRVDLPLMRPSLTSGAGLVLLSTVKELPATLILAPPEFRTLSTKVWGSYEDGFYAEVGVSALLLVALSAVLTWFLVLRRADVIAG